MNLAKQPLFPDLLKRHKIALYSERMKEEGQDPLPKHVPLERGLRRPEKRRRKASLHVDRGAQPPVSQHEPGQYCQTAKAGGRTPGGNSSGRRRPARHCRRRDRPVVQPPRKLHPKGQGDGNHASRRPHKQRIVVGGRHLRRKGNQPADARSGSRPGGRRRFFLHRGRIEKV